MFIDKLRNLWSHSKYMFFFFLKCQIQDGVWLVHVTSLVTYPWAEVIVGAGEHFTSGLQIRPASLCTDDACRAIELVARVTFVAIDGAEYRLRAESERLVAVDQRS